MTFDVIVKSYQRLWLLGVCLQSLRRHWQGRCRVIVADDGTLPDLLVEAQRRYGPLADEWVHSVPGEAKWPLCRAGRLSEVVPTCGRTWNEAAALVRAPVTFLIEDDSYLTRDFDPQIARDGLALEPTWLCVLGLKERRAMEGEPERRVAINGETLHAHRHATWPWSFDGIFYRSADWERIGPWPEKVATGPMEGFVQRRLRELDWIDRPYAVAAEPFCQFDGATSCRTDPANYAGRFRHVDVCNAAWLAGEFAPTYGDVVLGGMRLHYPRRLRQINYVTGHELCGDLSGAQADARWLSQANAEAARYGEPSWDAVPEECRSR